MSRGFKITRSDSSSLYGDRVDWLDAFVINLQAKKNPINAVEQARSRNESLFDQISAIISNKSPQSLVEAKVKEYQDKIGLQKYLNIVSEINNNSKKIAQQIQDLPEIFNKFPQSIRDNIKNFISNKCQTHHGNIQVPALVEEVGKTFQQQGIKAQDINDITFEKYISDQIIKAKQQNTFNDQTNINIGLGVGTENEVDSSSNDAFEGLNPAKF